ncbi:hypothetical protein [Mycoplasmopsis agassizii]|nr:hypothetical protein [Mycoplasmopsis agassizii]SMC18986.1 hypothetical protein SAMN02745179_00822 [Mycoplasmopsis agassizii]
MGTTIFTNNPSPGDIAVYFFMALFVVIIAALILWTKVIKKTKFSYTSSNLIKRYKRHRMLIRLTKEHVLTSYYSSFVITGNYTYLAAIKKIAIGKNAIYLIANPLEKNIHDVLTKSSSFITMSKKGEKLIHPELDLFIKAAQEFKSAFQVNEQVKVIIPFTNASMNSKKLRNIEFIAEHNLSKYILDMEKDPSVDDYEVVKQIHEQLKRSIKFLKTHLFITFKNKWGM